MANVATIAVFCSFSHQDSSAEAVDTAAIAGGDASLKCCSDSKERRAFINTPEKMQLKVNLHF